MTPTEALELFEHLTPEERKELDALIDADFKATIWRPLPGPQTMAYESLADVIGFGGSAGGGKTDLAVGKALTQHQVVQFFRREGTELGGIIDRMEQVLGTRDGLGGKPPVWRTPYGNCRLVEFGSCPHPGDEKKFQGRAKDLLVFDEAANFLESQVRFLMGWVRTVDSKQRTQTLMTFNPPTTNEGRWIIDYFAPWLDKKHRLYPTPPGVVRYCVTLPAANGVSSDHWVEDNQPCIVVGGELVHDFDPKKQKAEDVIVPQGRTFIPSRISDNPFLSSSGYLRQLQALPEPLRSQMLYGDFQAGMQDDPWQLCPTAWVEAAMDRWRPLSPKGEMLSMGVDVARGGKDNTIIACRHAPPDGSGPWIDKLRMHPGAETPDGPLVAGLTVAQRRDDAPVHIDVIGVGSSPYDHLNSMKIHVLGINVSESSPGTDKSGRMRFLNFRSWMLWRLREMLDPANDIGLCLPPDPELKAELCALKWHPQGMVIKVSSRDEIYEQIKRSIDRAFAVALCLLDTPKRSIMKLAGVRSEGKGPRDYDPYANL